MNILLVDDHAVVREGYKALLNAMLPECTVFEAADGGQTKVPGEMFGLQKPLDSLEPPEKACPLSNQSHGSRNSALPPSHNCIQSCSVSECWREDK